MKIIPAILTTNPTEAKELVYKAQDVGEFERVQIDIVDGVFAANKTVEPSVFEELDTTLKLDFQLMVKEPINWVEKCIRAQADRIIGHVEMMGSQSDFVAKVGGFGMTVGLGLDIDTPVDILEETILPDLDVILVMSVPAGKGGQTFDLSVWEKIEKLTKVRSEKNLKFAICVDGGVTSELVSDMEKAEVDEVAVGRRLFEGDIQENLERFK